MNKRHQNLQESGDRQLQAKITFTNESSAFVKLKSGQTEKTTGYTSDLADGLTVDRWGMNFVLALSPEKCDLVSSRCHKILEV